MLDGVTAKPWGSGSRPWLSTNRANTGGASKAPTSSAPIAVLSSSNTKPRAQLEARSKVPCGAKEKVTFDGVHPTHQLRLCKQRFQCEMCGGLVSATTPEKLPEILSNSCSFYRKFPPKQAPKVQVQTTSLHTFYVGSATGSQT